MYATQTTDPNVTVKAGVGVIIINNEGSILLERRSDNGRWGLIGGAVEPGESIIETAHREAREETGLRIAITSLAGIYSEPSEGRIVTYPDNGDVRHLLDIVLTAIVVSGDMRKSHESLDLEFFSPDNLPSDIVPPAIKPIRDFLEGTTCGIH